MTELTRFDDTSQALVTSSAFKANGYVPDENITDEQLLADWQFIEQVHGGSQWWIGDWLNRVELRAQHRGASIYDDVVNKTGLDIPTLMNYKWVAASVNFSLRKEKLSYKHHEAVAPYEDEKTQRLLLDKAIELKLSVRKFREQIPALLGIVIVKEENPLTVLLRKEGWDKAPELTYTPHNGHYTPPAPSYPVPTYEEPISRPTTAPSHGVPAALQSSESNEWFTPAEYIEAARDLMGRIDVDPASCELANKIIQAKTYYTKRDSGLAKSWAGRVWLNPPYGFENGTSNQELWTRVLIDRYRAGLVREAVLLVNANTEAKWFQPLYDYLICLTDHRIRFYNASGESSQPTQGNALIYFGKQRGRFIEIFSRFGTVVERAR